MQQGSGPLKTQLQTQPAGNTMKGWGRVLQDVVCALSQHPVNGVDFPTADLHGSRGQGVEMEVISLTLLLVTH